MAYSVVAITVFAVLVLVATAGIIFLSYEALHTKHESNPPATIKVHRTVNNRPIIGMLTRELSQSINKTYPDKYHSFLPTSYVNLIEGAGARTVPIWMDKEEAYYEDILSKVNGVVFPGGATALSDGNAYTTAAKIIYKIAKRINDDGNYFPLWGMSFGLQVLTYVAANGTEHRIRCSTRVKPLPLNFTDDFRQSRMFQDAPQDVIDTLRNEDSTISFHQKCITRDALARVSIGKEFRVIAENDDRNGLRFISALEHTRLPIYAVQFHPEKNIYEWSASIPHSPKSVEASQYFANFFVNEARKNNHAFPNGSKEKEYLMYNYRTTYTGLSGSLYEECYLFEKSQERS